MTSFSEKSNYEIALSLRGWGRRSSLYGDSEDYIRRFEAKIDGLNYDDKHIFDDIAYNFLPSEISAVFALVQFKKIRGKYKKGLITSIF